jgi:hypothetical protein
MPIHIDEVSVEIAPPATTTSQTEGRSDATPGSARVDPRLLLRELQRAAERAERLKAD